MNPDPTVDGSIEDVARASDYDTSEMMRQVFLRALSVPPPESPRRVRPATDPRNS